MAIDPGADRDDLEPDEELDAEAEERASAEGMLAPEEDPETWGELESEKLEDGGGKRQNPAVAGFPSRAPRARLELATLRLTAGCSTIELPRIAGLLSLPAVAVGVSASWR